MHDNDKLLPRYSNALSRPHDECLPMDELDSIQLELETLLSSVALRYRSLKSEFDSLDERKYQKKVSDKDKPSSPSTSGKRKREEKKSSSKDSSRPSQHTKHAKIKTSSSYSTATLPHAEGIPEATPHPHTAQSHPTATHTTPKLLLPKNDVPNKFWLSIEPYCMPITQEDIKMLDELIDEYSEPLVPSIPDLGPHYAVRWASDDLRDEQDNSNANAKANKRFTNANTPDVNEMLRKGTEKVISEGITGPLTQRLVAALVEESEMQSNIVGCSETITQDSSDSFTENSSLSANRTQTAAITSMFRSGIDVEKRLKKELLDLGILEPSDFAKDKEDEVLSEIKRVRTELQAIAEYNHNELKMLRLAAKEEMKRLDVKRKLDRIDQEIIEAYKKVWSAKQKRRPLTKHERNEIYRLSNDQKRLSDQLEAMPIPGFNYTVGSKASTSSSSMSEHASYNTK